MKIWKNKLLYVKLGLISPVLEIIVNIIYILSFLIIFSFFCENGKYYSDNQANKFAESYLNYEVFKNINTPSDFKIYLENLISKIYTINPTEQKLPIFIPINPIRITRFSNKFCKEENFLNSCNKNFQCVIDALSNSFKDKCGVKYSNSNSDEDENFGYDNKDRKKILMEGLVRNFEGFYSTYDLLHDGRSIEVTNENINSKMEEIEELIKIKNIKFISIEINLKIPMNNNYVDVILGLEMNQYFHEIKRFKSIYIFNTYARLHENKFLLVIIYFFIVSTVVNFAKLIYEIMVKPVFSIHLFVIISEACNILLFTFLLLYRKLDGDLPVEIDLKEFHTHLVYISLIQYIKIIMIIVFIGIPIRFLSLISWWKWLSFSFIKTANIFFRMIPGVIVSFIIALIFLVVFTITNYLIFQDIFSEYQTFYYSFLNVFNLRIMSSLYKEDNNSKIFNNLTHSKYVFFFFLFEYFFALIAICLFVSAFVHLYKIASSYEEPKQDSEYIQKMDNLIQKLKQNVEEKNIDLVGIKKQILYLNLTSKNILINSSDKIDINNFKNSQQIISFLKYLFALKPEMQFKNLVSLLNIVIEVNHYENFTWKLDLKQIEYLLDWLNFVGCKIPLIILCEHNFEKNYHLKLNRDYNLIKFVNTKDEMETIINKKSFGNFIIDNKFVLTIKSRKNIFFD